MKMTPDEKMFMAIEMGSLEAVKQAIYAGADVNTIIENIGNGLVWAVYHQQLDIVDYLIARGADVNFESEDGWTPLILAADHGYFHIVRYLVQAGVDPNINNRFQESAFLQATEQGYSHIARYLLRHGARRQKRLSDPDFHLFPFSLPEPESSLQAAKENEYSAIKLSMEPPILKMH